MPFQTILNILGGSQRSPLDGLTRAIRSILGLPDRAATDRASFTAAVVALSAKLSKSDGVTLKIEEETFERLFQFDPAEMKNVRWLFSLAAQDTAGFEAYAREVSDALGDRPELKHDIFDALLHIATADGILHDGEDAYLATVNTIFGFPPEAYRAARARFVRDEKDPYTILEIGHDASDDQLRTRYRELVRAHHPDALAAKGMSRELQTMAERKLAAINAAWDFIAKERGL